jgi:tetratricopeptide (TPR) repeat protein
MNNLFSRKVFLAPLVCSMIFCACALPVKTNKSLQIVKDIDLEVARLNKEGEGLFNQFRFAEAVDTFSEALQLAPEARPVRYNLALASIQIEEFTEAINILEDLLIDAKEDERFKLEFSLANAYSGIRDYKLSEKLFLKAFENALIEEDYAGAVKSLIQLSDILYVQGRDRDAICYALSAVHLDEGKTAAVYYATLLTKRGDEETFKAFVEKNFGRYDLETNPELGGFYERIKGEGGDGIG